MSEELANPSTDAVVGDAKLIEQQRRRSKPGEFKKVRRRVAGSLRWLKSNFADGELNRYKALDLGTRDGYGVEALAKLGCYHVEGVELVPETAGYAARRGRAVRQGDMQQLSDANES